MIASHKVRWAILPLCFPISALASDLSAPDCAGTDAWPSAMAFTFLKNANLIDNANVDFSKTSVFRLTSEKVGTHLYRQIHRIKYVNTNGSYVTVITVNDASNEECSMSGVDVYVIDKKLGDYTK